VLIPTSGVGGGGGEEEEEEEEEDSRSPNYVNSTLRKFYYVTNILYIFCVLIF
jgi:hypothetical protein